MKVPISISFEFLGHFRPKGCIKSQDVRYVRYVHSSAFPCQCRLSELFTSLSSLKTFKGKEWSWICICTYNIFEIQIQFEFGKLRIKLCFKRKFYVINYQKITIYVGKFKFWIVLKRKFTWINRIFAPKIVILNKNRSIKYWK